MTGNRIGRAALARLRRDHSLSNIIDASFNMATQGRVTRSGTRAAQASMDAAAEEAAEAKRAADEAAEKAERKSWPRWKKEISLSNIIDPGLDTNNDGNCLCCSN